MTGRLRDRNSLEEAKRKEAYIKHMNMQYGMALREKLNEDKAERSKHQRADIIRVKEGNVNE